MKNCRITSVSFLLGIVALVLVGSMLAPASAAAPDLEQAAQVTFRLEGINVPSVVQLTQFLVFTANGGVPPWTGRSNNNAIVSVVKTGENVFKIVPNSLGSAVIEVFDSRGGGKNVTVTVIPDKYGAETTVFNNNNGVGVSGGPRANTTFNIQVGYTITLIQTYHHNNGQGKPAGNIKLINNTDGRQYGPWTATQVSQFYWVVRPQAKIAPGTYTVVDSDPATWSYNAQSGNAGFVIINGMPRLPN